MHELHLICNAHLDPIWLWQWEEGAGAALSTFRTAADLCEAFDNFVFNHNEAILYRWVEEYEPALFERIRRLAAQGKWHIMGGWYLQPDCNLPSGEALVRQITTGLRYFKDRFGARPTAAVNFDSFGHSRGLVQILTQLGYRSYVHTRPGREQLDLPAEDYRWLGFDGTAIMVHREPSYNSRLGQAKAHVETYLTNHTQNTTGALLWGVGDHGGGPSFVDLSDLTALQEQTKHVRVLHSTPEAYFERLDPERLPVVAQSLRPCFVGCYTSQCRIKQAYRSLENDFFLAEKMCSHAAMVGRIDYPNHELDEALHDLLLAQFHDVIAGTSIAAAEAASLRLMHHGSEIASRLKARAFFALAESEPIAQEGEIPILVYNPHPFPVDYTVAAEYQLQDADLGEVHYRPRVFWNGEPIASQSERESSNVPVEFRKRVVFRATLAPAQLSRFACTVERLPRRPSREFAHESEIAVSTERLHAVVDAETGLLNRFAVDGIDFIEERAFLPVVLDDDDDSWGNEIERFERLAGAFAPATPGDAKAFGLTNDSKFRAVRIVEDGPVRMVVQALFCYENSRLCQTYYLPKEGTEVMVESRVYWNQQRQMLKLSIPTTLKGARLSGQTAYGHEDLPCSGEEVVAQKWCALSEPGRGLALTCINDGAYGLDFSDGVLRLSLLRSPAYSALPLFERNAVPDDRFCPRIDQGERTFRYWFDAGSGSDRMTRIDRDALVHNEKPMILSYFPPGRGTAVEPWALLDDDAVQITAFKKVDASAHYILRVFEPTGQPRTTVIRVPILGISRTIELNAFEIKTLCLNLASKSIREARLDD